MMCSNEQVRFFSLPGDGDPAASYPLRDMRTNSRLPTRSGEHRVDPALQPDASGSADRDAGNRPLNRASWPAAARPGRVHDRRARRDNRGIRYVYSPIGSPSDPRGRRRPATPVRTIASSSGSLEGMSEELTMMAVHAHPDDEASSTGGVLATYSDQGIRTVVVTCTNGEFGDGPNGVKPGADGHDEQAVSPQRLAELRESAAILGAGHLELLGYHDSGMPEWDYKDRADAFCNVPEAVIAARISD